MDDLTGALVASRESSHGDYRSHARVTQTFKKVVHRFPTWAFLSPIHSETIDMIFHKVGRILAGDPLFKDHWDDIAGYARLTAGFIDRFTPVSRESSARHVDEAMGAIGKRLSCDPCWFEASHELRTVIECLTVLTVEAMFLGHGDAARWRAIEAFALESYAKLTAHETVNA